MHLLALGSFVVLQAMDFQSHNLCAREDCRILRTCLMYLLNTQYDHFLSKPTITVPLLTLKLLHQRVLFI